MKLYEILLRKIGWIKDKPPEVQEQKIYNPIGAKVGGSITIDSLDYRGMTFFIKEIREYDVRMGGQHKFVDYVLLARPLGKPDVWARLRLVPTADSKTRYTHRAVVLQLYDEMGYSEDFHNVVKDESKKFVVDDHDKNLHEEYWRVNDVGLSYNANVKSLKDDNSDGKVSADEVKHSQIEFWDYSRMTDIDGLETEQFVFVEMSKDNGWFQIWRGTEIDPHQVDAI